MTRFYIGIDPGVSTGFAVLDLAAGALTRCETHPIHRAMREVELLHNGQWIAGVVYEDARLRKWFGGADSRQKRSGAGIREGVGSVKRDCGIWEDFLAELRDCKPAFSICAVKPAAGRTKWDAAKFRAATGWKGRTSNHARDAALLVWKDQQFVRQFASSNIT